jgi:uncharacterized protein (TIGR02594 family)
MPAGIAMTAFDLAQRYLGIREITGAGTHPMVEWWLALCFDGKLGLDDEIPWCSAFVNGIAWELRLPRSRSARARSWLSVGEAVSLEKAVPGFDVVILKRGDGKQPGPEVLEAPGHVGFFAGLDEGYIHLLGGNQSNSVSTAAYGEERLLGVRRLLG